MITTRARSALPLAAWSALLGGGAVLAATGVAATVLAVGGGLGPREGSALAAGACAGLVVCLLAVVGAIRLAASLRALHGDAVRRIAEPHAPVTGSRTLASRVTREVDELSRVLEALHLRARVADELGERHRREAETAGAGVFELLSGLVAAEEGARGQLAAELHDTVAQSLMIARSLLASHPTTTAELEKLSDFVEDAEEQVRAVMARTRPPALRDGDLASAIAGLRQELSMRYGLQVEVRWPEAAYPLPLASAVTVYRFFQEALLNVVKHADVDDATVELRIEDDQVVAEVRDEGPGFDPDTVRPDRGRHVGLGLLRERARLAGGSLTVDSWRGQGTTLTLRLPRPPAPVARGAVDHRQPTVPPQPAPRRRLSDRHS